MREARGEPHFTQQFACPGERLFARHAADEERHRHVLLCGELHEQVMKLVHEAQGLVAQAAALRFA